MRLFTLLHASSFSILSALDIQIDYTFDTNNFFNTQEKKNAIEAVADFYGGLLQDNLLRIDSSEFSSTSTWVPSLLDPATGNRITLEDIVIPEDTIIVYVGSRDLGGNVRGQGGPNGFANGTRGTAAWIDRLLGRGQEGAEHRSSEADQRTDIGPWGGTISFDHDSTWNFSLEENRDGIEFLTVALHEMGHVLGLGPSDAWDNLISSEGTFLGPAATASFGSAPPADGSHFLTSLTSPLFGSFGVEHGLSRPVRMLPVNFDSGNNFDVLTDLDLAALVDIGWEVSVPAKLTATALSPSGVSFTWPSSSFHSYEIMRTSNLKIADGGSPLLTGDGTTLNWNDPSPNPVRSFYQIRTTNNTSTSKSLLTSDKKPATPISSLIASIESIESIESLESLESIEVAPRVATGCYCNNPDHHN